ncbi:hypothetical protein [Qipengyuania sp. R86523]|uniref:hypothetical protein n=1 Tax=Qipengyuania sp. R86523 TaxID=3093862 RepID=UPI0037CBDF71
MSPSMRAVSEAPPLEWTRVPLTAAARLALCDLVNALEASEDRKRVRKPADRERLENAMEAMVCALFAASTDPKGGWRSYSRGRDHYPGLSRYNRPGSVSLKAVTTVADWLLASGYAEGQGGYFEKNPFGGPGGSGQMARIGATAKLVERLAELGMSSQDVGYSDRTETIILRDGKEPGERSGRRLEYKDTAETLRMRENLKRINEALQLYQVSEPADGGGYIPLPPFRLYRVFNRGSFGHGGRFYGGPWIAMPKRERAELLIDGETVTELDFGSLHPRMIYAIEGLPLEPEDDPYEVERWTGDECRAWVKEALVRLLNAGPKMRRTRPENLQRIRGRRWKDVLDAVEQHHSRIGDWFRSGRGLELQRLDSDIAERVLLDMAERDVCCLPVHDSFLVPSSHSGTLRLSMTKAYQEVMGGVCVEVDEPVIR